jgi:SAM-dependent methyltransferase
MIVMHDSVMAFGRTVLTDKDIRGKRVIEVGSMNVNGSLRAHVEALGPAHYVGIDFAAGRGVDLVCDARDLVKCFGARSYDVVISTEMLEHAKDWRAAVRAMKGILVLGGLILLTARGPGFPLHGFPHDWNRFTPQDAGRIFADFQIDRLDADPQFSGFLLLAHKPETWQEIDLTAIRVAPADAKNAPR